MPKLWKIFLADLVFIHPCYTMQNPLKFTLLDSRQLSS